MLLHLDYIFYIILILLIGFLIHKEMNTTEEGFEHIGKASVATQYNTNQTSPIKSAYYGYVDNDNKIKLIDVKAALDQLILKRTDSILVTHSTFGLSDPNQEMDKYLFVQFTDPYINITDALGQHPDYGARASLTYKKLSNAWVWEESDTMSLKFSRKVSDPFWITMTASFYKIADLFAYVVIKMPYQFLNQLVVVGVQFLQNFRNIFKPMFEFMRQMRAIAKNIFNTIFNQFKKLFKKFVSIMKDIPGFLKEIFDNIIDFLQVAVTKTFGLLKKLFDMIKTIFWTIIKLPMKLFDIVGQLGDVLMNLFTIIINIPTAALNMIIGFQEIMIDIMSKTPTIPFMNMFFK